MKEKNINKILFGVAIWVVAIVAFGIVWQISGQPGLAIALASATALVTVVGIMILTAAARGITCPTMVMAYFTALVAVFTAGNLVSVIKAAPDAIEKVIFAAILLGAAIIAAILFIRENKSKIAPWKIGLQIGGQFLVTFGILFVAMLV